MTSIAVEMTDSDKQTITEYVKEKKLNLSEFIRNAVINFIEEERLTAQEEKELLEALAEIKTGQTYTHEEVWADLMSKE